MTDRSPDLPDGAIRHFERGLEASFAADTIREVLNAVDLRALLAGEELEDPMDYERMGKVVGSIVGRLVVRGTVGRYTPGQFVEQTIGYTVGGVVGQTAVRAVQPERLEPLVVATIRDLERRPVHGKRLAPTDRESTATWTDIPIESPGGESGAGGDEGQIDEGDESIGGDESTSDGGPNDDSESFDQTDQSTDQSDESTDQPDESTDQPDEDEE